MPYLRCIGCGVVSYTPAGEINAGCPECGVPWPGSLDHVVRTNSPDARIAVLLRMTRDLLDADLAVLTEVRDGREICRQVSGDWPQEGIAPGTAMPLEQTICRRMLDGEIGHAVGDVAGEPALAGLAGVKRLGIGAWIGVPIAGQGQDRYVLCCLVRESRPSLGAREVKLLSGLAESVAVELGGATIRPSAPA